MWRQIFYRRSTKLNFYENYYLWMLFSQDFLFDLLVEDELRNLIKNKLQRGTIHIRIDSDLENKNKVIFDQEKYELLNIMYKITS